MFEVGATISFDDVRIYDAALTIDELAKILPKNSYDIEYVNDSLSITQYGIGQEKACVIIAWYDANGNLERTEIFDQLMLENGVKKTVNVNKTGNTGETVKIFVWNNTIYIEPRCKTVSGTEGNPILEYGVE